MDRSLTAVLVGTFTLRFSTGLTGTMLAVYLAKLPEHGRPVVAATTLSFLHATFYVAELGLSPIFGVLSDRLGHHRVMLVGPAFGAVAVILTGLTTNLLLLGGTRILEGASTAASVPSILGYIALVTAGNEVLRGKASARFEGATLAGLGVGLVVAPVLFAALGPAAFFLNALIYWGNRFKILRRTTIIAGGIGGGIAMAIGVFVVNHGHVVPLILTIAGGLAAAAGLFVLAGATPAAVGLLADMSERFPTDRGAIMGLYSVFLAIGQIVGSLIGG